MSALLSQPRLKAASELAILQNLQLVTDQARHLQRLQGEFLQSCLALGFASLRACLGEQQEPRASAHFASIIAQLVAISDDLRATIDGLTLPLTPPGELALNERLCVAAIQLLRCYEAIHGGGPEGAPTDRARLFLEFVTGLCMAWVSAEIRRIIATELLSSTRRATPPLDGEGIEEDPIRALWSIRPGTSGSAGTAAGRSPEVTALAKILDVAYLDHLLSVSSDAIDECHARAGSHTALIERVCAALKGIPPLHRAMRAICCMRHIPGGESGGADPCAEGSPAVIVSMAQMLHWSGIGGDDSGLWLEHEPLSYLAHHSLAYTDNFSKAAQVLGDLFADMRAYAGEVTARYLLGMAPREGGAGARIYRVFEDASGPNAQFASDVARRLEDLCGGRGSVAVHLSAADASGANLLSLMGHAERGFTPSGGGACRIASVTYRDLMLPPLYGLGEEQADSISDRYDAYLVSLALHHVTDGVHGLDLLLNAVRFGTHVVRPSGCLAFLEICELGSAVELLMPLDLVDRVGSVPVDIHEAFPFSALAVATRGAGPVRRGMVKLPWQRRELARRFTSDEAPTVVFLLLEVLAVPENLPAQLDEIRAKESVASCDRLLRAWRAAT